MSTPIRARIEFELEQDEDGYPPATSEVLWAMQTDDGLWQIDNIPFFVYGIALGDVVEAHGEGAPLKFERVVRIGHHATLRVVLSKTAEVARIRAALKALGCSSEGSHISILIAVDVPPEVEVEAVRALLSGYGDEVVDVEDGCERE